MTRVIRMLVRFDVPDYDERTAQEIAGAIEEKLAQDCVGTWVECRVWVPVVEEEEEEEEKEEEEEDGYAA